MMMLMIAEMMMIALMIHYDVDNYSDDYDGDDVYQCGRSWLEHS